MATPFLGQITMVGFNFAPRGWALCNGQSLPISQNQALFSILGTTYGGNGTTTFALPNLTGRVPMHPGSGPGINATLGQFLGEENHTLLTSELPAHAHGGVAAGSLACGTGAGTSNVPGTRFPAVTPRPLYAAAPTGNLGVAVTSQAGGNQPHSNMQAHLVLNFIIALQGIFPSRN